MKTAGIIVLVIIVAAVGFTIYSSNNKSNAQKFAECSTQAGEIYDSSRQTITQNASGYNAAEQNMYYKNNDSAYARDLESCRQLYSQ